MPWQIKDVEGFIKGLSDKQKAAWVSIANSTLDACLHNGGNAANCEGKAVRIANAKAQEIKEAIMPAKFNCECIKCGFKFTSEEHCADLKCPKCGGQMRRAERPGPGQPAIQEAKFVIITESVLSESKVDREGKIIHNVVILNQNSLNASGKIKRSYTDDCLDKAVSVFEGAPAFIDHPGEREKRAGRSIREQFGFYRGVKRVGEKLIADDLVLYDVPDAALIMSIAEKNPKSAGNSIYAAGRVRDGVGKGAEICEELLPRTMWGHRSSVDLVYDPATTRGIFESRQTEEVGDMEWAELTKEVLTTNRKDLVESIKAEGISSRDQEVKDISEKLTAATVLVDGYKAKDVLAEKTTLMEKLLKESKLPAEAQTETFRGVLMAVQEKKEGDVTISVEDGIKALIEDRVILLKPAGGVKNMGGGKTILESKDGKVLIEGREITNKEIAESIKRH